MALFLIGCMLLTCNIIAVPGLSNGVHAETLVGAATVKISGYISPDFVFDVSVSATLKKDFKVELPELGLSELSDVNGYFEITNIPVSTISTVKISKSGYLYRTIKNVTVNGSAQMGSQNAPVLMWAGDTWRDGVQDNAINMSDIMEIAQSFNASKGGTNYMESRDINLDSAINMTDIMIVAQRFNKTSLDYPAVVINTITPTPTTSSQPTQSSRPTATPTSTISPTATPTQNITPPPTGANVYFVDPRGNDSNPGTKDKPFLSLSKAVSIAVPGTTIYMRGGKHNYNTTVSLAQSGTETAKINILAYPGEKPVLDYSTQPYGASNRGINLTGSYWYIKGIEICYAGDNGIKLEGSYNVIENCVFHHNGDSGLQMGFGHDTPNPGGTLCSYNQIINCDSYLNFDFDNAGSDADGFACKMHNGKGNKFYGCRAWRNGDDGWDLFETDWPVEIINCWTWHNADKVDFDAIYLQKMGKPMSSYQGNGNGFKLGGNGTGGSSKGTHVVKNCISFDNNFRSKKGFDQNSHKGGVIVYNCVSFGNGYNYMFEDSAESGAANEFKNNVSFACRGSLDHEFASGSIEQNNSWNLPVKAEAADFKNLSEELAKAQRKLDGSLPDNDFARLVPGSDLIDKGVHVGLPYNGTAPDLGAFEF